MVYQQLLFYSVQFTALYVALRYIPHINLNDNDALLTSIVIVLTSALVNLLFGGYSSSCKEGLENTNNQSLFENDEDNDEDDDGDDDGDVEDENNDNNKNDSNADDKENDSNEDDSDEDDSNEDNNDDGDSSTVNDEEEDNEEDDDEDDDEEDDDEDNEEQNNIRPREYQIESGGGNKVIYKDFNNFPENKKDSENIDMDQHGYWILPPKQMYPSMPNPPVCVPQKECPICPIESGSLANAMPFRSKCDENPSDNIHVNKEKNKSKKKSKGKSKKGN
jgi:hypothetical protein